jgi:hypothetical protein
MVSKDLYRTASTGFPEYALAVPMLNVLVVFTKRLFLSDYSREPPDNLGASGGAKLDVWLLR